MQRQAILGLLEDAEISTHRLNAGAIASSNIIDVWLLFQ